MNKSMRPIFASECVTTCFNGLPLGIGESMNEMFSVLSLSVVGEASPRNVSPSALDVVSISL